jgi:hypothetical protein
MKRFPVFIVTGLVITAGLLAALGSASSAHSSRRPALQVTLYKQQASVRTRRVTASSSGAFRAVLQETGVDRCDTIFVRAVGTRGSNAALKMLPRPACHST